MADSLAKKVNKSVTYLEAQAEMMTMMNAQKDGSR